MSLDIYLYASKTLTCDCGKVHEIEAENYVFDANITHNLNKMAEEVGIYDAVWRLEGIETAKDLIEPLNKAIVDMKARPTHYKKFDASNGWGTYEDFLPWLEELLNACKEYPDAKLSVSR